METLFPYKLLKQNYQAKHSCRYPTEVLVQIFVVGMPQKFPSIRALDEAEI